MDPYDHEPSSGGGGGYLKLKKKGDVANIRIASEPFIRLKIWDKDNESFMDAEEVSGLSTDELNDIKDNDSYKVSAEYSWVVIDREDKEAKVYSASPSIFSKIAQYKKNSKWGDPSGYDLEIVRTEKSPAEYYTVTPDPNKSKLTDRELELADAVNLPSMVKGAITLVAFMEKEKVKNAMGGGDDVELTEEEEAMTS